MSRSTCGRPNQCVTSVESRSWWRRRTSARCHWAGRSGATTTVTYRPSTEEFLRDAARPTTRWRTTLPFGVHVVLADVVGAHRQECARTDMQCDGGASDVALVDVAHWASEFPWCTQAADLLRSHFGDSLPVRVSAIRTDPWNVERNGT